MEGGQQIYLRLLRDTNSSLPLAKRSFKLLLGNRAADTSAVEDIVNLECRYCAYGFKIRGANTDAPCTIDWTSIRFCPVLWQLTCELLSAPPIILCVDVNILAYTQSFRTPHLSSLSKICPNAMSLKPFSLYVFSSYNPMPQVMSYITLSLFLAQECRTRNRSSRISSTTMHIPHHYCLLAPACDVLLVTEAMACLT